MMISRRNFLAVAGAAAVAVGMRYAPPKFSPSSPGNQSSWVTTFGLVPA